MMSKPEDWFNSSAAYVAARAAGEPDAWSAEAKTLGRKGSQILREVATVAPPPQVSDMLRIATDEKVVVRRRTILLDDRPIELADSYYPLQVANGTALVEAHKIPGGAPTLLAELGFTASEVHEEISVRRALQPEAETLEIRPDSLVIELFRVTLSSALTPFEVSIMTMIPEGRHFRYHLKVD